MSNILMSNYNIANPARNDGQKIVIVLKNGREVTVLSSESTKELAHKMENNEFVAFHDCIIRVSEIEFMFRV